MSRVRRDRNSAKKKWILVFVIVSVFCIIFFSARGSFRTPVVSPVVSTIFMPFQRAVAWAGSQINYVTSSIWDVVTVHRQNKMLRNEVVQLRQQNLQAAEYAAENERLRSLLDYKNSSAQFDMVAAKVIGRESATWSSMMTINRGSRDGIAVNMPVVNAQGLVGKVIEVGPYSSKVQLILDPRSSVGTLVQRVEARVAGIVQGDSSNPTMPRMVNIPKDADVVEGDVIITSGFGGIYPKGLVVGLVDNIKYDSGGLLKIALLETAVDFQKLEDVMVITASREAPPQVMVPPPKTPGTEDDSADSDSEG